MEPRIYTYGQRLGLQNHGRYMHTEEAMPVAITLPLDVVEGLVRLARLSAVHHESVGNILAIAEREIAQVKEMVGRNVLTKPGKANVFRERVK